MLPSKAVFAGCARDCAPHLDAVLGGVGRLAALFAQSAFVFVENDSKDGTAQALAAWGRSRENFVLANLDGLDRVPVRGLRLATARNRYLEVVRGAAFRDFDYLVVLDMDERNAQGVEPQALERAVRFLEERRERAAGFANQDGIYYDLWALRHRDLCPGDIWEEMLDCVTARGCSDHEAFQRVIAPRIVTLDAQGPPLEVTSAFGGFGIYRMHYALQSRYEGARDKMLRGPDGRATRRRIQVCEHVPFNEAIVRSGGRLFVLPWLINGHTRGQKFVGSYYRSLLHDEVSAPDLRNEAPRGGMPA